MKIHRSLLSLVVSFRPPEYRAQDQLPETRIRARRSASTLNKKIRPIGLRLSAIRSPARGSTTIHVPSDFKTDLTCAATPTGSPMSCRQSQKTPPDRRCRKILFAVARSKAIRSLPHPGEPTRALAPATVRDNQTLKMSISEMPWPVGRSMRRDRSRRRRPGPAFQFLLDSFQCRIHSAIKCAAELGRKNLSVPRNRQGSCSCHPTPPPVRNAASSLGRTRAAAAATSNIAEKNAGPSSSARIAAS